MSWDCLFIGLGQNQKETDFFKEREVVEEKFLNVETRSETGSARARQSRRQGYVPAVMYAEGSAATSLRLHGQQYHLAVRGCKPTQIFRLKSEESSIDGQMVLIKDVQIAAVSGQVQHVDFLRVSEGHRLVVTVALELFGDCTAVKENRAFLNQNEYEIEVECLPNAIPEVVRLDISPLKEGGSLHASDIPLPEGVRLMSAGNLTVVSAISLAKKAAEEAAEAAAAATAAAPAAAAATPAADKDKKPAAKK